MGSLFNVPIIIWIIKFISIFLIGLTAIISYVLVVIIEIILTIGLISIILLIGYYWLERIKNIIVTPTPTVLGNVFAILLSSALFGYLLPHLPFILSSLLAGAAAVLALGFYTVKGGELNKQK
ncbi:hypothetical protein [Thermosynechococcus sp. FA-CM-4201]